MSDKDDIPDPWLEFTKCKTWEVHPHQHEITVNIGADQNVIIDKLYGPLAACDVRVRLEFATCEWVFEAHDFNNDTWVEKGRFFAQEFHKMENE